MGIPSAKLAKIGEGENMIMIEGNLNSGKIAICNIYHTVGTFRTLHYLCNLTCYIV